MSGCPVRCLFCATGKLKKCRNLTAQEIVDQIQFVLDRNPDFNPLEADEFKINYTRMGEPFLNIKEVKKAIELIDKQFPNAHHYISTIGIQNSDFSWITNNITLQLSLHSLNEDKRNWLIPFKRKMLIKDLGKIKTNSNLKTTLNMTLIDQNDFCGQTLQDNFDPKSFFIKLSPVNTNEVSKDNGIEDGYIKSINLR